MTADAVLPVLTFLAGQGVVVWAAWWTNRRTQTARVNDFQRTTLLELQDSLPALFAAVADTMWETIDGRDPDAKLATEWGEAAQRGTLLTSRVRNDDLRSKVEGYLDQAELVYTESAKAQLHTVDQPPVERAKALMPQLRDLGSTSQSVLREIGRCIRELD